MSYVAAVVVGLALLLLGGCGNESSPPPAAGQESTVSPSTQPPTPGPSTPAQGPVEQAKSDLTGRLGISASQVTVVSSQQVTWRDASLGCPQPGMQYAQVLTNGSRIVLEAGGKRYEYHSGVHGTPVLCANPQPPLSSGG
jgi:hypothetical protein